MPYVNIPNSGLGGAIAKIVGKIQGNVSAKVVKQGLTLTNKLNMKGCPSEADLKRMRSQKQQLDKAVSSINSKLSKFQSLPGKLKGPLGGLKAALKIILTLPIPQGIGIPPGPAGGLILGLPINITTKYADTMHLLKEFVAQISELVEAITVVLETPTGTIGGMKSNLSRAENALKACEAEAALKNQLAAGNLNVQDLKDVGLVDDNEIFIFSTLGPKLLGVNSSSGLDGTTTEGVLNPNILNDNLNNGANNGNIGNGLGNGLGSAFGSTDGNGSNIRGADGKVNTGNTQVDDIFNNGKADINDSRYRGKWNEQVKYYEEDRVKHNSIMWICIKDHVSNIKGGKESGPPGVGPWKTPAQLEKEALDALNKGLENLEKSNLPDTVKDLIKGLLDGFNTPTEEERKGDSKYFHTGPNGIIYELEILIDPNSPSIAPRRFAIAKDASGVTVMKGPKSFSSSTDVLLDEIKFRIDNQLP